jgi:Aldehyde dehydrogenase family
MQFTGSTRTGRAIEHAGRRLIPYSLELGGKDASTASATLTSTTGAKVPTGGHIDARFLSPTVLSNVEHSISAMPLGGRALNGAAIATASGCAAASRCARRGSSAIDRRRGGRR